MSNIIQEISDRISTPNKYSVPIPNRLEAIKYHDAELMLDIINGYYNEIGYRSYEYPIFKVFKDSEEQAEYCKSGNYEYYGSDDDSTTDYIYGMYYHRNEEKYYRIQDGLFYDFCFEHLVERCAFMKWLIAKVCDDEH